ncbi:MAG: hypothetical protein K2L82_17215 [Lachnospiraceae bacterium]|nr:hypothetical protein [Lachnospiraceae bacterium]
MMDQYKKETSQIHAPADLIQRTKQAVREEERRIEQVQVQQRADANPMKQGYGKVYKWALPVAAAVLIAVLMNASTMMIGRKFSASQSDSSMNMAADMAGSGAESGGAAYDFAAAEAEEEGAAVDDTGGSIDKVFAENGLSEAPAASAAEYDSVENESDLSEDSIEELTIKEVREKPEFIAEADTERIIAHGLRFYVTGKGSDMWKAYVYFNKQGYVITGDIDGAADGEAFAEKAYELLVETVEEME